MDLKEKRCVPCEGGVPALAEGEARVLLAQIPGWELEGGRLRRRVVLDSFPAAMAFLQRVADLAEAEGHHPDFCVHYRQVDFTVWTHAVSGLSENDFILAAKISAVLP